MSPEILRFIRFAIVGLSNTAVDLLIFNMLLFLQVNTYIAASISFIVAVTNSYVLNRSWTFRDRKSARIGKQYTLFLLTNTVGLIFNTIIIFLFTQYLPLGSETITANLAKIVAIVLVVFWNYAASRIIVFRSHDTAATDEIID